MKTLIIKAMKTINVLYVADNCSDSIILHYDRYYSERVGDHVLCDISREPPTTVIVYPVSISNLSTTHKITR